MPGRNFACVSFIAVLMLAGMAPVSANEHTLQHATTHRIGVLESQKAEAAQMAQIKKEANSEERARTAQLNVSQIDPQTPRVDRGPYVSVGPQARAFQRIRDIAMAPTG